MPNARRTWNLPQEPAAQVRSNILSGQFLLDHERNTHGMPGEKKRHPAFQRRRRTHPAYYIKWPGDAHSAYGTRYILRWAGSTYGHRWW
jgi:hypothetical protein